MWLGEFGTAVGDRGETLESEDRQRDGRHEAGCAQVSARGLERDPTCPETGHPEQRDAADLEYGHDDGQQPYRPVAGDVHEIGNDDQPDATNRNQKAVKIAAERPKRVSPEGDRKGGESGIEGSARVALGGPSILQKKKNK